MIHVEKTFFSVPLLNEDKHYDYRKVLLERTSVRSGKSVQRNIVKTPRYEVTSLLDPILFVSILRCFFERFCITLFEFLSFLRHSSSISINLEDRGLPFPREVIGILFKGI